MLISDLINELLKIKNRDGDLFVQTGTQGTESFRELDFDKDFYIWGFLDQKQGLVINENAIEIRQNQYKKALDATNEIKEQINLVAKIASEIINGNK